MHLKVRLYKALCNMFMKLNFILFKQFNSGNRQWGAFNFRLERNCGHNGHIWCLKRSVLQSIVCVCVCVCIKAKKKFGPFMWETMEAWTKSVTVRSSSFTHSFTQQFYTEHLHISVPQRNRAHRIYIYVQRDLLQRTGKCDYRSWEVPRFAAGKQETWT